MIHETTHQWFGDLVTFAWWNDAWLNEGFTQWLQWKLQREWGPEWRDDLSAIKDLERLVEQDVRPAAHPVRQKIETPDQIETEFDDITYFKTAQVLQAIEHYIGAETLQKCIRSYMRSHLWGNATSQDFSDELAKANAGAAISFEQYLNRTGLPQVSTELDCSGGSPVIHLRQETFRPLGVQQGEAAPPWTFPVCIRYSDEKTVKSTCALATKPAFDMQLEGSVCPAWLVANPDATGYYISRYDRTTLEKLLRNIHSMGPLDRIHAVWEMSFLASSGKAEPSRLLNIIDTLGPPFTVSDLLAAAWFSSPLLRYETSSEVRQNLTERFETLFGETGRKLGWTPPPGASEKQRQDQLNAVSSVAILSEDRELMASARELTASWLGDRKSVPADVVRPLLFVAGRFANVELYEQLLRVAKEDNDPEIKTKIFFALAVASDPKLIQRNLTLFRSGSIPLQQSLILFFGPDWVPLHVTPEIRRMRMIFLRDHSAEIRSLFPKPLGRDYSDMFAGSAKMFCSEGDRKLADAVLSPILRPEDGGSQRLAETLDAIRLCTVAREATQADFVRALAAPAKATAVSQSSIGNN